MGHEVGVGSLVECLWLGFVWVLALSVLQAVFSPFWAEMKEDKTRRAHLQGRSGQGTSVGIERDYTRLSV